MPADFDIEVNAEEIEQMVESALQAVEGSIRLTATDLWGNLRAESPLDEGRLAGSFELTQDNELEWRIFTNVLYALFVAEGTGIFGPHGTPIVPVSAPFLVFEIAGQTIFARSTRGMEADPYVDRAFERTEARIDEFAQMALSEVGL